jgi:salicylate hydroxylase
MLKVAIVGGGLGGLTAALCLRAAGIDVSVHEQAGALRELGAGIVVPPNMVRPWTRLGLLPALESQAVRLEAAWEFRRWQDGRVLFSQAMGEACESLYGAHCYVAHRADLLAMLQQAFPAERLHLDQRCVAVEPGPGHVSLSFESRAGVRTTVNADLVIGADGIHSLLRTQVAGADDARFSGLCAFRCLVPAAHAPAMALRPVQTLWLGPGRHLVHYPVSAGRLVNVVAIVPADDWRTESWTAEGSVDDMVRAFDGWDARVEQLLTSATHTRRWALYDREPLARWCDGRLALLGDAAHAMLPFFAQGAAQAVEDAFVLAECLRGIDAAGVPAALQRYESQRRPRASQVQRMSRGREIRNHLPDGPEQILRDAELARGDPLRASAWLYGHDDAHDATAAPAPLPQP